MSSQLSSYQLFFLLLILTMVLKIYTVYFVSMTKNYNSLERLYFFCFKTGKTLLPGISNRVFLWISARFVLPAIH